MKVENSEEPDFIIKSEKEVFGVEITDYYFNESSARLKNYKGYTNKILNSNSDVILDKRDKGFITKVGIFVKSPEESKYKFITNTIQLRYNELYSFGELPDLKDVEKQIIQIIQIKNNKAKHYKKRY